MSASYWDREGVVTASAFIRALAHSDRLLILAVLLMKRNVTASQLSHALGHTQARLFKQLYHLERSGLVIKHIAARAVQFSLAPAHFATVSLVLGDLAKATARSRAGPQQNMIVEERTGLR